MSFPGSRSSSIADVTSSIEIDVADRMLQLDRRRHVVAKRHLQAIPTKRRSVSFLGVAFFFVICFSYEAQRIRPNLDLSK